MVVKRASDDISKKTVLVILLIAIVVSIVSTWTVLDTLSSVRFVVPGKMSDQTGGKVFLQVGGAVHREPQTAVAGAMVYLKVD